MNLRRLSLVVALGITTFALAESGPVRLAMPTTIYGTPGVETNLYLDNVVLALNPANYTFNVDCPLGMQQAERWTVVPTAEEVGHYTLTLRVLDGSNAVVAEGSSAVVVTDAAAVKDRAVSVLVVGDSLTHASVYTQTVLDHAGQPDRPTVTLIGSHVPKDDPANRHEGYGGWTAARFATHFTEAPRDAPYKERSSPFVYKNESGETGLDFPRYCADNNGGVAPDVVTIFLGCNDTFSATDENIESVIDTMLGHMDALIAMIHDFSPTTKIGLIAPVPPTSSQDAFGFNYKNNQTRWQYRRNQHRVVERMMAAYGDKATSNISLIPAYINLDCVRNYPETTGPANSRNESLVTRQNNSVHPAASGYQQLGDSLYGWLLAGLSEG